MYVEYRDAMVAKFIDSDYYYGKIRSSLAVITDALGIDLDPIYSGAITTYGGCVGEGSQHHVLNQSTTPFGQGC
jgi:hypothetical protein